MDREEKLKFADLHIHTSISDGWLTPEETVEEAYRAGLAAISIADHDSVGGIRAAIEAGSKYGVEVIPGVELHTGYDGLEFHILGYFVDWRDKWFNEKLLSIQEARIDKAKMILERLRSLNIDISNNVVIVISGGVVGRPQIAQALLDRGYVRTVQEAFERYLGIDRPAYVGKYPLSPTEAIRMIRRVGGISALAHPVFSRTDEVLPELVDHGLQAIEVYHSKHDVVSTRHFEELAKKYDLLMVGGSDAHGREVPIGAVRIPYRFIEKLKEKASKKTAQTYVPDLRPEPLTTTASL